jgi:hypothetical protein
MTIKLRSLRWACYVALVEEIKTLAKLCLESLRGSHHLEDQGVESRIILKRALRKESVVVWTKLNWPGIEKSGVIF